MNEAFIGPDEYQARPSDMPPIFMSALAVMLLAFGGTIALPWNILDLVNGREFQDLSRFQRFVWDLFTVFSFLLLLRWCTIQCLVFRAELAKSTTLYYDSSAWPGISILVPAYQEAENIESTLRSLMELEYKHTKSSLSMMARRMQRLRRLTTSPENMAVARFLRCEKKMEASGAL